jgi:hypothetical protein
LPSSFVAVIIFQDSKVSSGGVGEERPFSSQYCPKIPQDVLYIRQWLQKSVFLWLLSIWLGQNFLNADFECRPLPDGKDDEDVPEGDGHANEAQGDQRTNHLNTRQVISGNL